MLTLGMIDLLNTIMIAGDDDDADADDVAGDDADKEADASDADEEEDKDEDEEMVPLKDYRRLRSETASYRKQLKALEDKVDASTKATEKAANEAEIAKLEGIEKEQALTAQARTELDAANVTIVAKDAKIKADAINTAVYRVANAAGFRNPEDVALLLKLSGIEVTDGEVDIEEITELVNTLAESRSNMLKDGDVAADYGGGASNPKDSQGGPKVKFTSKDKVEQLKQQSAEARERGDMTSAVKLYNIAWEQEHGVKPA